MYFCGKQLLYMLLCVHVHSISNFLHLFYLWDVWFIATHFRYSFTILIGIQYLIPAHHVFYHLLNLISLFLTLDSTYHHSLQVHVHVYMHSPYSSSKQASKLSFRLLLMILHVYILQTEMISVNRFIIFWWSIVYSIHFYFYSFVSEALA